MTLTSTTCDEAATASPCSGSRRRTPGRYSQGPGAVEELWAVDVDGRLVVLDGRYFANSPQNAVDELRAILASATFE